MSTGVTFFSVPLLNTSSSMMISEKIFSSLGAAKKFIHDNKDTMYLHYEMVPVFQHHDDLAYKDFDIIHIRLRDDE